MKTLAELKASSPAYADIPDDVFARKVYEKHYAGKMSFDQFMAKAGGGKPDFSNFQSGSSTTERPVLSRRGRVAKARAEGEAAQAQAEYDRMQMDGSRTQQALIGAGDALTSLYRGPKQLVTDQALRTAGTASMGLRNLGFGGVADMIDRNAGAPLMDASQSAREAEAQRRADTENLAGSIPAQAGKIGAYAATAIGPSYLSRGTAMAPVLLPNTIKGNALLGAAYGAAQPYTDGGDQAINTLLGGAFGGGLAAVPGAAKYAKGLFGPRLSMAERRAGQVLTDMLNGRQLNVTPSSVPGVQRTLGEASLDPGMMSLERNVRRLQPDAFSQIDSGNNAARVSALQRIAGTDADMAAAETARETSTASLRNQAFSEGAQFDAARRQAQIRARQLLTSEAPADGIAALRAQLESMAQGQGGRSAVQQTLRDVNRAAASAPDTVPGLYRIRQTIGDLLDGKAGSDKSYARAATRELMQARQMVDDEIGRRMIGEGPSAFPAYLNAYQQKSIPINRMQIGRELLDSGSAGIREGGTGLPRLTPGTFARASDLDTIAQRATGFNKARAADILTPDDIKSIGAIQDDLQRQFARQTNPAQPGSATMEATELTKRMLAKGLMGRFSQRLPGLGPLVEGYQTMMDQALQRKLAYLVANPSEAQRVLSSLPPAQRSAVERALLVFGQGAGTVPVIDLTKDAGSPLPEQQAFYPGVR